MSQWYYAINRREMGPVSELELKDLAAAGALRPSDLVWREGAPEWVQAGSCAELFPDGVLSPARPRDRLHPNDYLDGYDRRRLGEGIGPGDDFRSRPARHTSGSGWIVGLCVVGVLLIAMVVCVVAYFVVANGPGGLGHRGGKVWEDRLTVLDAPDPTKNPDRQGCPCKVYTYHMTAGTEYEIEMMSSELDSFLRLEDPSGKEVAFDDDSGGGVNRQDARIIHTAKQTGVYKIYATICDPFWALEGDYTLRISP